MAEVKAELRILRGPHYGFKKHMPSPTEEEQQDPIFEAIWQTIKSWDVNAPEYYDGYCGANGSHVLLIMRAIKKIWSDA